MGKKKEKVEYKQLISADGPHCCVCLVDRRQPMAIKAMTERDEERNTDSVAAVLEGHVVL